MAAFTLFAKQVFSVYRLHTHLVRALAVVLCSMREICKLCSTFSLEGLRVSGVRLLRGSELFADSLVSNASRGL
jgi:hypothetical protein